MRAIWKGSISFGLVSIGVKLYTATEERDVSFHQVRRYGRRRGSGTSASPRPTARRCRTARSPRATNSERRDRHPDRRGLRRPAAADGARRGRAAVRARRADRPDLLREELLPRAGEERGQAVRAAARRARHDSGQVGLVKVAIRNREQLATLRVRDGVIVMETMIWPDEVREPAFAFLDEDIDLRPQERSMARVARGVDVRRLRPGASTRTTTAPRCRRSSTPRSRAARSSRSRRRSRTRATSST